MKQPNREHLRAGAALVDITPSVGTHLSGSGCGEHHPAISILDPLFAKAIVFEPEDQHTCIITLNAIQIDYTDKIRSSISERIGVSRESIMVHATQTHSAPSIGYFMLDSDSPLETTLDSEYLQGGENAYADFAVEAAILATIEAWEKLQTVRIGLGRGIEGDLAFNRRGIFRNGTITMSKPNGRENQPFGIRELCYLEGPIDPEVGVLCIQDMDMKPLAFLLRTILVIP